jgi:hypothetical protein
VAEIDEGLGALAEVEGPEPVAVKLEAASEAREEPIVANLQSQPADEAGLSLEEAVSQIPSGLKVAMEAQLRARFREVVIWPQAEERKAAEPEGDVPLEDEAISD